MKHQEPNPLPGPLARDCELFLKMGQFMSLLVYTLMRKKSVGQ